MLKSRRISTILFASFGVVIFLMLVLTTGNLYARSLMLENYTNLSSGILTRQTLLTKIERDYYLMENTLESIMSDKDNLRSDFNRQKVKSLADGISDSFSKAFKSLESDTLKDLLESNSGAQEKQFMTDLEKSIGNAFVLINNLLDSTDLNQASKIENELNQAFANTSSMITQHHSFVENKAGLTKETLIKNSNGFTVLIQSISAIIVIIGIALSIVSVRTIKAQIEPISRAAKDVRDGNFDVHLLTNSTNEMSRLSNDIGEVVGIFQALLSEINRVSGEFTAGRFSSKIDVSKFSGEYKNTAYSINNLLNNLTGDVKDILKCMESFSNGVFDVDMKKYEGEKAAINTTVEKVSFNLQAVNSEINEIVKQAASGNLDVVIDEGKYEGDWKSIMISLNKLITAVKNPVNEVLTALEAVSKADFSVRINASYGGQFEAMKKALNFTVSTISDYIKDISSVLNQVANQNLRVNIKKEYIGDFVVVKKDINEMIDVFSKLISGFNDSAANLAIGVNQISHNNSGLAQGASEQTKSVEALNSAIEKMSEKNTENVETAKNAGDLSSSIYKYGIAGKEKMNSMLLSVEKIQESSNNVLRVISVIDSITFQINLLALNAAVEAARAGAAGKGFSVVAEEVRSLAERSKAAATETANHVMQAIDAVKEGAVTTSETAEAINLILANLSQINTTIQKVEETSREQEQHIVVVENELSHIVNIAHHNTSASEENASSSEELSSQAYTLKQMLSKFVI